MKITVLSKGLLAFTTMSVFTVCTANAQILLTYDAADSIPEDGNSFTVAGTPGYGDQVVGEGLYAFELMGVNYTPYVGPLNITGTRLELFDFPGEELPDGDYVLNPFHSTSTPSGWVVADQLGSDLSFEFYYPSGDFNGIFMVAATANLSGTIGWSYYDNLDEVYASGTVTIPASMPLQFVPEPSQLALFGAAAMLSVLFIKIPFRSAHQSRSKNLGHK